MLEYVFDHITFAVILVACIGAVCGAGIALLFVSARRHARHLEELDAAYAQGVADEKADRSRGGPCPCAACREIRREREERRRLYLEKHMAVMSRYSMGDNV